MLITSPYSLLNIVFYDCLIDNVLITVVSHNRFTFNMLGHSYNSLHFDCSRMLLHNVFDMYCVSDN